MPFASIPRCRRACSACATRRFCSMPRPTAKRQARHEQPAPCRPDRHLQLAARPGGELRRRSEVVAESWGRFVGGENVMEGSFACIDAWRHSPGHWGAVAGRHSYFGYDICQAGTAPGTPAASSAIDRPMISRIKTDRAEPICSANDKWACLPTRAGFVRQTNCDHCDLQSFCAMDNGTPDVWFKDGLKFRCTMCGDCCTGQAGRRLGQRRRGRGHSPLTSAKNRRSGFCEWYTHMVGDRRSLVEKPNGDCIFYERAKGCTVYAVRPRQCRTWPFWESNLARQQTWKDTCKVCPGSGPGRPHSRGGNRPADEGDQAMTTAPLAVRSFSSRCWNSTRKWTARFGRRAGVRGQRPLLPVQGMGPRALLSNLEADVLLSGLTPAEPKPAYEAARSSRNT